MAILTQELLKKHLRMDAESEDYDDLLDEYIRFSNRKAFQLLGHSEASLIAEFVEAVENIDGFDELSITIPDSIGETAAGDTFKNWLDWVADEVFPLLNREQLAEVAWYADLYNAAEEACILLCEVAAREDGIKGETATFGVGSVSKAQGGLTITTVYLNMRPRFEEVLLPYRRWRIV